MENKERNTEKIDSKIKPSTLTKILTRAEKERRNKSEMIRVILEESFEESINTGLLQSGKRFRKDGIE